MQVLIIVMQSKYKFQQHYYMIYNINNNYSNYIIRLIVQLKIIIHKILIKNSDYQDLIKNKNY